MRATIYKLGLRDAPWRYALKAEYSADMVEAIKSNIPSRQRKWCPDIRQWWFTQEAIESVLSLANRHYDSVHHSGGAAYGTGSGGGEGSHTTLSPAVVAAYRTLYLAPAAPPELVKAAYRALCKIQHPDAGGTTSDMQQINEAYARLKNK